MDPLYLTLLPLVILKIALLALVVWWTMRHPPSDGEAEDGWGSGPGDPPDPPLPRRPPRRRARSSREPHGSRGRRPVLVRAVGRRAQGRFTR